MSRRLAASLTALLIFLVPLDLRAECQTRTLVDSGELVWVCAEDRAPFTGYLVDKLRFDQITKDAELWQEFGLRLVELSDDAANIADQNSELLRIAASREDVEDGPGFLEYLGAGAIGATVGGLVVFLGFVL